MSNENKKFNPVDFRKAQEHLFQMTNAGVFKELAKYHRAIFDAYIETGFTEEQALSLLIAEIHRPRESNENRK